jgi:hypothetical protein
MSETIVGYLTRRSYQDRQQQRISRDFNAEPMILSSAAPGRLPSASSVTSRNAGFEAQSCPMVVNPRHH